MHQRTREGIETARRAGKRIGTIVTKKSIAAKETIKAHAKAFGGTLTDEETMRLCDIARNTYYRHKKALLLEQAEAE